MRQIVLDTLSLATAERALVQAALEDTGSMVEAAQLLGVSRRVLARLIIKYEISWPQPPRTRPATH